MHIRTKRSFFGGGGGWRDARVGFPLTFQFRNEGVDVRV